MYVFVIFTLHPCIGSLCFSLESWGGGLGGEGQGVDIIQFVN
jgi:hypothetical protein